MRIVRNRGQGLTEYLVIIALVIVTVVGVLVSFGDDVRHLFDSSVGDASSPGGTHPGAPAAPKPDAPKATAKPDAGRPS